MHPKRQRILAIFSFHPLTYGKERKVKTATHPQKSWGCAPKLEKDSLFYNPLELAKEREEREEPFKSSHPMRSKMEAF